MTPDLESLKEVHTTVEACWEQLSGLAGFCNQDHSDAEREKAAKSCGMDLAMLCCNWIDCLAYIDSEVDWFAGERVVNICGLRATSYHKAIAMLADSLLWSVTQALFGCPLSTMAAIDQRKKDGSQSPGPKHGTGKSTTVSKYLPLSAMEREKLERLMTELREKAEKLGQMFKELPPLPRLLELTLTDSVENLEEVKNSLKRIPTFSAGGHLDDVVLTPQGLHDAEVWLSLEYNRALRQFVAQPQPLEPRTTGSRFRPAPCTECGGRAKVTSTKETVRHFKCENCDHTWTGTRKVV